MMKVAIVFATAIAAAFADECPNVVGAEAVADGKDGCDCGDAVTCAKGLFCVKTAKVCYAKKVCAKMDGSLACGGDAEGGCTATVNCAKDKFCYAAHGVCLDAALADCAKKDGSEKATVSCKCKETDVCKKDEKCTEASDAGKRCAADVAACAKKDGSTKTDAECKCKDDKCAKDKFCDESADAGKQCLDAAKTTTKATTKAATTKAAAAAGTTKKAATLAETVLAAETAAVAKRTGFVAAMKALDETVVLVEVKKVTDSVAGVKLVLDDATVNIAADGTKMTYGKINSDVDLSTVQKFCDAVAYVLLKASVATADATMFKKKCAKSARRVQARALAAANYDITSEIKTETEVKADAKKAAEAAFTAANGATGSSASRLAGVVAVFAGLAMF